MAGKIFRLSGALLIRKSPPSFATPLFSERSSNYDFIQDFGEDGKVTEFTPIMIESPLQIETEVTPYRSMIGDEAIFAFCRSFGSTLFGTRDKLRTPLIEYYREISSFPYIRHQVAKFVGDRELVSEAARAVAYLLRRRRRIRFRHLGAATIKGGLQDLVSLGVSAVPSHMEDEFYLVVDMHAGSASLVTRNSKMDILLRSLRLRIKTEGCAILTGPAYGDWGPGFSSIRGAHPAITAVSGAEDSQGGGRPPAAVRKTRSIWEIDLPDAPHLSGRLLGDAPLCSITVFQEQIRVVVEVTVYPKELLLESEDLLSNDLRLKMIKLVLRKALSRNGDEIVVSSLNVEGSAEYI